MVTIHKYTSSAFIQSGSIAEFKTGIRVSGLNTRIDGNVFADGYFDLNGNEITGGTTAKFFAGTEAGVSNDPPFSQDTFIQVLAANSVADVLNQGILEIKTTGSSDFKPNFFNFLKVGDENNNLITVQQGGLDKSSYSPTSVEERSPGVHKYIIFAAETGSSGETHQVFHTVTINQFLNNPPQLDPVPITPGPDFTIQLDHDSTSKELIIHFTGSSDIDEILGQGEDFLKKFQVKRTNAKGTSQTATLDTYTLDFNLVNDYDTIFNATSTIGTIEGVPGLLILSETPGLSNTANPNALHFTASLSAYDAMSGTGGNTGLINTIHDSETQTETLDVLLGDSYFDSELNPGTDNETYQLNIIPPPTASIKNIRVKFEGSDNDGGFTNQDSISHTHTVLYNFTGSLSSESIANFHDRYTSSLIRIKVMADIEEPSGYTAAHNHHTFIQVKSGSNNNLTDTGKEVGYFRFNGNENTASFIAQEMNGNYIELEDNDYLSLTQSLLPFNNSITNLRFGVRSSELNRIDRVQHGSHDHYHVVESSIPNPSLLTVNRCPDIFIEEAQVEVESGSFGSNIGHPDLTSSLLYGLTSSLFSSETASIFADFVNNENYLTYISQSIIRLRIKAKITEPFGPSHNTITASFSLKGASPAGGGSTVNEFTLEQGSVGVPNELLNNTSRGSNVSVSGQLDVSSYLSNPLVSSIEITSIEIRGDINLTTEDLDNFTVGNNNIGNITGVEDARDSSTDFSGGNPVSPVHSDNYQPAVISPNTSITYPQSVDVNNGIINISYVHSNTIDAYPNLDMPNTSTGAKNAYQVRITFRELVTNVPVESDLFHFNTSSEYNSSHGYTTNHNHPNGSQTNKELLVSTYTSSWQEFKLEEGIHEFIPQFQSSSNVNTGTILDLTTTQSAIVSLSATPVTRYEDINYEVETFGYSNIGTNSSTRVVLYGDNHITNDGTASGETGDNWANHQKATEYASASVSRFRVSGKIVEPVGIELCETSIQLKIPSIGDIGNPIPIVNTINNGIVSTNDNELLVFRETSYENNQLVTKFTSSFQGKAIGLSSPYPDSTFTISSSIGHTFNNPVLISPGVSYNNGSNVINTIDGSITVKDTPQIEVSNIRFYVETSGYSNELDSYATRTVLYGDPNHTNNGTGSGESGDDWANHDNSVLYASHSVTRFKMSADVKEPLGPLVKDITLVSKFSSFGTSSQYTKFTDSSRNQFENYIFLTGSSENVSFGYNENHHLTASYTSSFRGKKLEIRPDFDGYYEITENGFINLPGTENQTVDSNTIQTAQLNINNTPPTNIDIEEINIETFGESNINSSITNMTSTSFPSSHIRTILANETETRETGSGLLNILTASAVLRTQIDVTITEPIGYLHHATQIGTFYFKGPGNFDNRLGPRLSFATNSNEVSTIQILSTTPKLQIRYISNFIGDEVPDGIYRLRATDNVVHDPSGEYGFISTGPKQDNFIKINPSTDSGETTISNLKIEIETISGSGVQRTERTTNVLHGKVSSETNPLLNNTYPDSNDREQLVSARVLATIQEPISSHHLSTIINIGGNSSPQSITLNTGSSNSDVSHSLITPAVVGTGQITKYTSSFFPLLFNATPNELSPVSDNAERITYTISASVSDVVNSEISTDIPFTLSNPSNTIDIHVTGALSSSVSGTINIADFGTSDVQIFSSSFNTHPTIPDTTESLYFIYPSGPNSGYDGSSKTIVLFASTSAVPPLISTVNNIVFNDHLDINYASSNNSDFILSNTNPSSGTASIAVLDPNDYNNTLNSSTITLTVFDTLDGASNLFTTTQSIFVIPASPANMEGDFASFNIDAHSNLMEDEFFEGALASASLINYSGGIGPLNPATPLAGSTNYGTNPGFMVSSSRIALTRETDGTLNYSMSLKTHNNVVYSNANYSTANRAFIHGDTGSLEIRINGEQEVLADLGINFLRANKAEQQVVDSFNNGGFTNGTASFSNGKGRLILNNVKPFNGIHQNIVSGGIGFPNGYQAFDATIQLDDKIRDGYNYLEFIHNIFPEFTQSLNTFDWYYNDGPMLTSIKPTVTMSWAANPNATPAEYPTHSISGVSYFRKNKQFTASIGEIYNIANKHYSGDNNITQLRTKKFDADLTVRGGTTNLTNNNGSLLHKIQKLDKRNGDERRGLKFSEGDSHQIPTAESTASIVYKITAVNLKDSAATIDPIKGDVFNLQQQVRQINRNHSTSYNGYVNLSTNPIGRWMYSGSNEIHNYEESTNTTENFFNEDRRWESSSLDTNVTTNPGDLGGETDNYTFWVSSSRADFNSTKDIANTVDLQQTYRGRLRYPSGSYTEVPNPNQVDYSNASGDRGYCRAFQVPDVVFSNLEFDVTVLGKFDLTDITDSISPSNLKILILVKLPGPNTTLTPATPGSQYGAVNFSSTSFGNTIATTQIDGTLAAWAAMSNVTPLSGGNLEGNPNGITFRINMINKRAASTNGVMILKIIFKDSLDKDKYISKITLSKV